MTIKPRMSRHTIGLVFIWLVYVILTVLAPAAQATTRYGLSLAQVNLLRVTILIPYLFIWLAALYAVVRFRRYAALVKSSPEGPGFNRLTEGLWMLLLVVIVPPFITLLATFYPQIVGIQKTTTILVNYITIIFYLAAFWYIWQASRQLNRAIGDPAAGAAKSRTIAVILIVVLSALYVWAIFHNPFRTISTDPLIRPTYYLPDWLILLTIVLPYIVIWVWGSLAILNIRQLAKHVQGSVYRRAFLFVAYGLLTSIGLSILLRFISQASIYFGRAGIGAILGIIYLLLIAIAVGYVFIARGAKALSAIEEVQ